MCSSDLPYTIRLGYISRHVRAATSFPNLVAIKTGHPGTVWQLGSGAVMKLTARDVIIDEVD